MRSDSASKKSWSPTRCIRACNTAAVMGGSLLCPIAVLAQESSGAAAGENRPVAGYAMLMMILLLMIVIMVFGWFLMRSLHRSRKRLGRSRLEPTDATDVWSMHKLPESDDPAPLGDADNDADDNE